MSDDRPLWERMREAADVLEEATTRRRKSWPAAGTSWRACDLRAYALEFQEAYAADQQRAELEQEIAEALMAMSGDTIPWTKLKPVSRGLLERFDISPKETS